MSGHSLSPCERGLTGGRRTRATVCAARLQWKSPLSRRLHYNFFDCTIKRFSRVDAAWSSDHGTIDLITADLFGMFIHFVAYGSLGIAGQLPLKNNVALRDKTSVHRWFRRSLYDREGHIPGGTIFITLRFGFSLCTINGITAVVWHMLPTPSTTHLWLDSQRNRRHQTSPRCCPLASHFEHSLCLAITCKHGVIHKTGSM